MGTVLIVEDNADLQKLYQIAIRKEGISSLLASDGQQALDLLKNGSDLPRLILLDLMMPIMDGWQFLEEKELDPNLRTIPVVVCSASQEMAPKDVAFMKKPVDLKKLQKLVSKHCKEKLEAEIG